MATTVAQLQAEVVALKLEVATLRGEMEASVPMLQAMLADAIAQIKAQVATLPAVSPKRVAPSAPCGTGKTFATPKEAMAAAKELAMKGTRCSVSGCTLTTH